MALTELKGKALGTQRVVIERGPVKVFAQALLDDDPVYMEDHAPIPATFPFVMPYWGSMGQGGAAGLPIENLRGKGRAILHGEQEFVFHDGRWPHTGDVLVGDGIIADVYEKERSDGGKLEFYVTETTWKDEKSGDPIVTSKFTLTIVCKPDSGHAQASHVGPVPYTPAQLSDRAEILDVVHRYAWSIDSRDWDALDTCFTDDAYVDYSSNPGGHEGPYRDVRRWLERNLAAFAVMQHLMVNVDITLDGDPATVRTMMVNPMGAKTREGPPHFFYIGGRYDDEFVRTAGGWRIARRVETLLWFEGSLPTELLRSPPSV